MQFLVYLLIERFNLDGLQTLNKSKDVHPKESFIRNPYFTKFNFYSISKSWAI